MYTSMRYPLEGQDITIYVLVYTLLLYVMHKFMVLLKVLGVACARSLWRD